MNVRKFGIGIAFLLAVVLVGSITSCGGASPAAASSTNSTTVAPPTITVSVSPSDTTVTTSLTAQFTATVTGGSNTAVTWSVNGVAGGNQAFGTITASGLYTAPALVPTPAIFMIAATSVANPALSADAQVRIVSPISILLSPQVVILLAGQTQSFTASVSGPVESGVTWTVNGLSGGNANVGTVASLSIDGQVFTAQYTAPSVAPFANPLTVQAVSTVDPGAFAAARVFIRRDTQLPQETPIKLGTSGGNASDLLMNGGTIGGCCSGTLGSLLSRGGDFYILSNNHVLDKSDQGTTGDPIVQPGLGDANCQAQNTATVAHLSQAPALHGAPYNVDAAIAAIVPGAVDTTGTILGLAGPNQAAPPSATLADAQTAFSTNEPVAKVGRSSGLSCSTIAAIGADIVAHYEASCGSSASFQVSYTNQIIVVGATFSEPGDSGSLVMTADTARPLGLLYAGNGSSTAVNPIQDVLSALKDPSTGEIPRVVGAADRAVACPNTGQAASANSQPAITAQLDAEALQSAQLAKNQYEIQLLQNPAVSSVAIGSSDDDPGQTAIILRVNGPAKAPIPHQVGGVRTKVVFDQAPAALALSKTAITSALQVKNKYASELLSNSKVFGVGVGASKDSPGEAAIVIYVDRTGKVAMPIEVEGMRTQIVRADPFRTSGWGNEAPSACSKTSRLGSTLHSASPKFSQVSNGMKRQ